MFHDPFPSRAGMNSVCLPTLCDFCANACGHCPWSQKNLQSPVPGWDAVRHDLRLLDDPSSPLDESYIVFHCPLFLLEAHRVPDFRRVNWSRVRQKALEVFT